MQGAAVPQAGHFNPSKLAQAGLELRLSPCPAASPLDHSGMLNWGIKVDANASKAASKWPASLSDCMAARHAGFPLKTCCLPQVAV